MPEPSDQAAERSASALEPFPARLHVLLARSAPTGVVIRRGPSKHFCTIGWDRRNDRFTLGQWLKGRMYERRSDLSPDGKLMIYFAMNGRWESQTRGSWTTISLAPYLRAIGLWAKGDTYHGGGLFTAARRFWLNDGEGHERLKAHRGLERQRACPYPGDYGPECPGVYYLRLQRDGWTLVGEKQLDEHKHVDLFEKPLDGGWVLRKLAYRAADGPPGKGSYYDEHELYNSAGGQTIDCHEWEWADVDRSRLVWAEHGKLFAGRVQAQGVAGAKELHDFNSMTFEVLRAPY